MIDFSKINEFGKGKSGSFEALVKILARREQPVHAMEFQPNDGRGGDGGVEAIWINGDGTMIGYQAKYFDTLGNTQWTQMDKSVATALENHPQLTSYIFALPFDLTAKRKQGRSGDKSQQEKWEERVAEWKALAAKKSITIEFELWDETALTDKLLQDGNGPLVKLWFGGDVLDDQWFERQVASATLKLDDRFNPDDHVEVSTASMFDAIVRGPAAVKRLHEAFSDLANNRVPTIEFTTTPLAPDPAVLKAVSDGWDDLVALRPSIDFAPDRGWAWPQAQEAVGQLRDATWKLEHPYNDLDRDSVDEKDRNKLEVVSRSFRDLSAATNSLGNVLRDRDWVAEASRCALVLGEAGSGKSHLLAQVASERVQEGLPTVVVLGQDLAEAPFWPQLGGVLGLEGNTAEDILGVLNAVGERKGQRALLLFDAINEGVGASYWMHWMPEVVAALRNYPYIAAVFSCRDVYSQYAIPETLLKTMPIYRIQGFVTPDERERAAIQYLDKKGISRPNTPWLSPEFSNPLFLKSTSEALLTKGETEFPRGLRGLSELMLLYLEGLSVRTGLRTINAGDMSKALTQYVRSIAVQMANDGHDYVTVEKAHQIAAEHFGNRQPPEGKTWLDVFTETSLLRRDPPPYSEDIDPLDPPSELIRFSFQRFQDFLMANTLVAKVIDMKAAASTADGDTSTPPGKEFMHFGPLNFIFYNGDPKENIRYEYAGLVGALSTIYPEKIGREFAMSLPNWEQRWEQGNPVQDGFGESFKWRRLDAFTDDTRELLNRLDEYFVDPLGLLLEVSMTIGHPFNAERLHNHLGRFKLAERDSYWTRWINWSSREEFSQIDRIVSWALSSRDRQSDERHLQLASLVLAWSLSSSHMTLRDRATKALTTVFLKQSGTFEFVLDKMYDCDDPYIIERLYAAAFGACCIDPSSERLEHYSQQVFAKVFADGKPPVALLTRDYALGIIELAESKNALGEGIQVADCYHPFGSDEPEFDLTKEQVEEIADQRGGKSIFRSASSEWGDYGKYSIPGRVSSFLTTHLVDTAPISASEIKDRFDAEVISPHPERVEALKAYNQASIFPMELYIKVIEAAEEAEKETETIELDVEKGEDVTSKEDALSSLQALLSDDENQRLTDEYFNDAAGHGEYRKVSVDQCRLWITKRAYELGWTKELFPRDGHGGGYSRHDNDLERIGKKYQRIALDELQARLADNFWALQGWGSLPGKYKHSHHDYRRNLEPTLLPGNPCFNTDQPGCDAWMIEPRIDLPEVSEDDLKAWPFLEDPGQQAVDMLVRKGPDNKEWLVLYDHVHSRDKYSNYGRSGHNSRMQEFRFFQCVLVQKGKAEELAGSLENDQEIDVWSFKPTEYVDGPFLGEAFWRDTWNSVKFSEDIWKVPDDCPIAIPVASYQWESHLDKSLKDGFSTYLPQRWFAEEFELQGFSNDFRAWYRTPGDDLLKVYNSGEDSQSAVVVERSVFEKYNSLNDLEPVWLFVAERNVWPNGDNGQACWRRSEAAIWHDGKTWQKLNWARDTRNG